MQISTETVAIDSSQLDVVPNLKGSSRVSSAMQVVIIAIFMLAMFFGYGRWRTGSFESIWPWLVGQQLLFTPTQIDLGTVSPNQVIEKQIRVTNVSSNALSLLGSQKSCGCIALDEFPISIAAKKSRSLVIKIATGTKSGTFAHTIKFFADDQAYSSVVVSVQGSVM